MVGDYFTRQSRTNVTVRFEQYETAMSMIRANPLLWRRAQQQRRGRQALRRVQLLADRRQESGLRDADPQLLLDHALVEVGVVGFLLRCSMSMFVWVGWQAWRLARRSADPEGRITRPWFSCWGSSGLGAWCVDQRALRRRRGARLLCFYAGVLILSLEQSSRCGR